jgi:hypothetical protein
MEGAHGHSGKYPYQKRAVAFLDVLGFRQHLTEFEKEAEANKSRLLSEDDELAGKYMSQKANDFIYAFQIAISRLDKSKYRYYLFSDNICISSIEETTAADLQDLLLVITKLFFEFAQRGYFLRGGIDYGLFIDEEMIAVGNPLAVAYELETKKAVYPRIVISQKLIDEFQSFNTDFKKEFELFYSSALIQESCEIKYLNIFLHVFQSDSRQERESFFAKFNDVISQNLEFNKKNETVFVKYRWLAEQFNQFIDSFVDHLAFMDTDFNPDDEPGFLDFIKQQKINYAN